MRRTGRMAKLGAALAAGFVAGAVAMIALQSPAVSPPPGGASGTGSPDAQETGPAPAVSPEPAETFLAWVPGGLPAGFGKAVAALDGMNRSVLVRSGVAWLTRSFTAEGEPADRAPRGYGIPIEVAAVPPSGYAPFLPPADRGVLVPLAEGEAVLGETGAALRGLGPGAVLEFGTVRIRVAAVLADELVGAHELMVSRATGMELGVRLDRYVLMQPAERIQGTRLVERIRALLPPGRLLRTRAPGEAPYFRHGDAILPPITLKELFGEFAGRPVGGGFIEADPAWIREHIVSASVPILGEVRCHEALIPMLRAALREVVREGFAGSIHPSQYGGCYAARFVNRVPALGLSHHSWGIAIDINVASNPYGARPNQDPRVVEIFRRHGFLWGGEWLLPDGMHFEFDRFA